MVSVIDLIREKLNNNENVLITAIGDSITFGVIHCNPEETYCAELARLFAAFFPETTVLRYDGIPTDEAKPLSYYEGPFVIQDGEKGKITVVRCGVGGDTVRRIIKRSDDFTGNFITGEMPDYFLIMLGINDALKNDPQKYIIPEKFYSDLEELFEILENENSHTQVILMTPTYNDLGESHNSHLEPYCNMMKKIADEKSCKLIDTHSLWMEHLVVGAYNYGQQEWLGNKKGDSCHFSPTGSIKTAEFIFNNLK